MATWLSRVKRSSPRRRRARPAGSCGPRRCRGRSSAWSRWPSGRRGRPAAGLRRRCRRRPGRRAASASAARRRSRWLPDPDAARSSRCRAPRRTRRWRPGSRVAGRRRRPTEGGRGPAGQRSRCGPGPPARGAGPPPGPLRHVGATAGQRDGGQRVTEPGVAELGRRPGRRGPAAPPSAASTGRHAAGIGDRRTTVPARSRRRAAARGRPAGPRPAPTAPTPSTGPPGRPGRRRRPPRVPGRPPVRVRGEAPAATGTASGRRCRPRRRAAGRRSARGRPAPRPAVAPVEPVDQHRPPVDAVRLVEVWLAAVDRVVNDPVLPGRVA